MLNVIHRLPEQSPGVLFPRSTRMATTTTSGLAEQQRGIVQGDDGGVLHERRQELDGADQPQARFYRVATDNDYP
ncbi:MAG: hypothetical protein U5J83_00730 [Bryobacterales bacterium]|nr:hypothetical protein [Bryobacterales bacterium]